MNPAPPTVSDLFDPELRATGQLPVEVHCHGFGPVDFSDLGALDLDRLEAACVAEGVCVIPTLYLHHDSLDAFEAMLDSYAARRADGELRRIVGIALEGPLLASHGGTPRATVWLPTWREWERLAACGRKGLVYTVMSPDAFAKGSGLEGGIDASSPRFEDFVPLLASSGVRPALGHFARKDPSRSAAFVERIIDLAWQSDWTGPGLPVVTDHLFNDMPLAIRHAFRTSRARADRDETIASYRLEEWTLDRADEILGPVPAAIMRNAAAGRIAACINFDGEHVDPDIAKRAIELMGDREHDDHDRPLRLGPARPAATPPRVGEHALVSAGRRRRGRLPAVVTPGRQRPRARIRRRPDLAADRGDRAPGVRALGRRHVDGRP